MKKIILCCTILLTSGYAIAQKDVASPGTAMRQVNGNSLNSGGNLRDLSASGSQHYSNTEATYRAGLPDQAAQQPSFSSTGGNTQLQASMEKYTAKPLSEPAGISKNGSVPATAPAIDYTGNPVKNSPVSSNIIKRKIDDEGTGIITVDFGTLTRKQKAEIYFPYNPVTLSNSEDLATQAITAQQFIRYINLSNSKAITKVVLGTGKKNRDSHTGAKQYNGFLVHFNAARATPGTIDELVQVETTSGSLRLRLKGNVAP